MAKRIYVGNIPHSMSNEELKEVFEAHGEVVSADIIIDRETNRSRGFGFVEMASQESAKEAIEALNGAEVGGRPLTVNEARERQPAASGGRRRF